jgi:hypothetical protein
MTAVWEPDPAGAYFSDEFSIEPDVLEAYGALDMSVVTDLPLFIDPFLLLNSANPTYRALHTQIIEYLRFLRSKADLKFDRHLIAAWYTFGEVKQNWLGFIDSGNSGHRTLVVSSDDSSAIWGGDPVVQGREETLPSLVVSGW